MLAASRSDEAADIFAREDQPAGSRDELQGCVALSRLNLTGVVWLATPEKGGCLRAPPQQYDPLLAVRADGGVV